MAAWLAVGLLLAILLRGFFFNFHGALGVEPGFIGRQLMQQSEKFPRMDAFLVGNFRQHLDGPRVVGDSANCMYNWVASYSEATMKRMALTSSSGVSFLSLASPEKGDPKLGMLIFLGGWQRASR